MSTASFIADDRLSWTSPAECRPMSRRALAGSADFGRSAQIVTPKAGHVYGIDPADLVAYRRAAHAERAIAVRALWADLKSLFSR